MSNRQIRVRFAPSPTGHLHIGGLRTAIFNWLFARHNGGKFLLRIEDTDLERSRLEYVDSIMGSMSWMGLDSDEPVVFQLQQAAQHRQILQQLLDSGRAYRCYCAVRKTDEDMSGDDAEQYFKYSGHCYQLVGQTETTSEHLGQPFVVRFRLPKFTSDKLELHDLVKGLVTFPIDQLDDFIIARSDGSFMYNFAVVADDILMDITHVIRGEEHLNNGFKQQLIYEALGKVAPRFAHIPLILNAHGGKLSKRDGAVSAEEYRRQGYLAPALCNYLVRLGWSHGNDEVLSVAQMIEYFSLDQVGSSGAIFDLTKLQWLNSVYLRAASSEQLLELIKVDLGIDLIVQSGFTLVQVLELIKLYQERVKLLTELPEIILLLSSSPESYDQVAISKFITSQTPDILVQVHALLSNLDDSCWNLEGVTSGLKDLMASQGLTMPQLAQPIRLALTGHTNSPSVFHLVTVLGKVLVLTRIDQFLKAI